MNNEMFNFWNENGYLIIENFKTEEECKKMWPQAYAEWTAETENAADFGEMRQSLQRLNLSPCKS